MGDFQYDAFISHSHVDIELARRLSERIRRYRAPRALNLERTHLVPFRDVEQLTITDDLTDALVQRLKASKYLIVLCSPTAAKSKHVNQEIDYFAHERNGESILTVLCAGEPEESFPRALKAAMDEPLFGDLRPVGGRLSGYQHFRAESLRIIASLLGVDYSEVAREDDRRRRRTRALSALGVTTTVAAIAAVFLINSVEPQAWQEVPLPTSGMDLADFTYGNPLMPVRDIAFNKEDPADMVLMVRDAEWHGQKPHYSIAIREYNAGLDLRNASELAIESFEQSIAESTQEPVLSLAFQVEDHDDNQTAEGTVKLLNASMADDTDAGFYQVLSITSADPALSGRSRRYIIPTKQWSGYAQPVLDWPADVLFADKLIPRDGVIKGEFENHLDGSSGEFEYRIMDAMDEFLDGIGPERFDRRLASNVHDLEVEYEGLPIRLADVNAELEIWQQLLDTGNWVTYTGPEIWRYRITGRARDTENARIEELADQLEGERALAGHLARSRIDDMEGRSARILSRDSAAGRFRLASLLGQEAHGIASAETTVTVRRLLFLHSPGEADWRPISVPTTDPAAPITDFHVLDSQGRQILLVFRGEGYFRSLDGGETWQDFNVGEKRLATDGEVKTIVVGAEPTVYALVDNDTSGEGSHENFLFRLERRDWQARLRIALIDWLRPPQ